MDRGGVQQVPSVPGSRSPVRWSRPVRASGQCIRSELRVEDCSRNCEPATECLNRLTSCRTRLNHDRESWAVRHRRSKVDAGTAYPSRHVPQLKLAAGYGLIPRWTRHSLEVVTKRCHTGAVGRSGRLCSSSESGCGDPASCVVPLALVAPCSRDFLRIRSRPDLPMYRLVRFAAAPCQAYLTNAEQAPWHHSRPKSRIFQRHLRWSR